MASQDIDPRLLGLLLMGVKATPPLPTTFAGQIVRWFRNLHGRPFAQKRIFNLLNAESSDYDEFGETIEAHLHYMADLGLLQPVEPWGDGAVPPLAKWRLSSPDELRQFPPRGTNGGGGGRRGGDNRDPERGDGDGVGGGGVREVLSHPTLFALPQQEFEDFVQGLFDEPEAQ
ncbi:hypothetical protein GTP81_12585 [Rugamonas sp. FT107W]|uniref:Uncharacterized protein n=1 Tax=Duganella vulcania TaxID=2692166 RepID=A0A845HFS0_9BURK|nr:hypothetical protein [Duganella vulcania]MYN17591.1 hypothetical protein [Duganella vulcania]